MTATSTKVSPQNITLLYHKSFAIIPSRSRPTVLARRVKIENEGFALLHAHVVIITSNSVIPRRRWAEYRYNAASRSFMLLQPPISLLCGVVALSVKPFYSPTRFVQLT